MKNSIYFDNNSTTKTDPEVLEAMMPYLTDIYGNASSSSHSYGRTSREAVEYARKQIAELLNCDSDEIYFTSGSTESINLALKGTVENSAKKDIHIISSVIEHHASIETCKYLQRFGIDISYVPVDGTGLVNPDDIKKLIRPTTIIVNIMTANNEIGTIQPINEIADLCNNNNILFHTDAAQAFGKIPINLKQNGQNGIDMMSFSGHKIYGPKGIGALYVRKNTKHPFPQIHGGGQEKNLRSGTLNVPSIAGFGKSAELAKNKMFDEFQIHTVWRDRIIQNILRKKEGSFLNGHPVKRLPNNINIGFRDITSSAFISKFKEFSFSYGSACSSETLHPSYVLSTIGRTKEQINSSVRIGLGRFNTEEEINFLLNKITTEINKQ